MVYSSDAKYLRFNKPGTESSLSGNASDCTVSTTAWTTMKINYSSCTIKDQLDFMIQGGVAGETNVVYIAWVMEGDQTNN